MISDEDISLREYLHLMARQVKNPPCIDKYDEFLIMVWEFFNLRVAAEDFYNNNRHVAYSRKGALPVSWQLIKETWEHGSPPEQVITLIAKRNYADVRTLISNLRKVLNRVRQKIPIGRVQQLDSHCLRWLTRQPGRSAIEKGGARQEILGIVRVENYNTLENRVFKDFLARCIALTTMYLRSYETKYPEHPTMVAVRRLKSLCIGGLAIPELEGVQELHEFPQPNYVLQQDRVYSRIWASYVDILRLEDVAERLWDKRKDIASLYERCNSLIAKHCSPRAKYNTPLWINELDGRKDIIENPIWDNEIGTKPVCLPAAKDSEYVCGGTAIIDFTNPWDRRDALFYPSNHRNARPYLQNPHQPSLEPGTSVSLHKILRTKNANQLEDYFIQLDGEFRKKRWVVLVPDDWESEWLESIIRARPWNLTSRDSIFLLWRSVATVLGYLGDKSCSDGETIVVVDGHRVPDYNAVTIRLMKDEGSDRVLPQRSSVRLHGEGSADVRFKLNRPFSDTRSMFSIGGDNAKRLVVGLLNKGNLDIPNTEVEYISNNKGLLRGVKKYLQDAEKGLVSYFDELDGLSIIITNAAEEVLVDSLVDYNEKSPGGVKVTKTLRDECWMMPESKEMNLCLYEGTPNRNDRLKRYTAIFDEKTTEKSPVSFVANMTPGQGLAAITVSAEFLQKPVELDLRTMVTSNLTIVKIEENLERHFPPVMPLVEASRDLWRSVDHTVRACIRENREFPTTIFTMGRDKYANDPLPLGSSPIEKLRRVNVFGNDPDKRYPISSLKTEFEKLVTWLVSHYKKGWSIGPLAWMYQFDNNEVEFIREELVRRYVVYHNVLRPEEISFCCNNMPDNDKRISKLLDEVLRRTICGKYNDNDLRLIYNLLQFHYSAIASVDTEVCEKAMQALINIYNASGFLRYINRQQTKLAGYLLKSMLFLLHRRRYDAKFFLKDKNWDPPGDLNLTLDTSAPARARNEITRKIFRDYVRGCGTLKDFPTS